MSTVREAKLRVVLWGTILALVVAPLAIHAQDEVPANAADPDTSEHAEQTTPDSNPTSHLVTPRKGQSAEQQLADEWECYDRACEQTGWDPYGGYAELVDAGYAQALARQDMEDELVRQAIEGAETGAVAGEIAGMPRRGARWGVAVAVALELMRSGYLDQEDDPEARRAISGFERELRNWDRKFAACLRPKGYKVQD